MRNPNGHLPAAEKDLQTYLKMNPKVKVMTWKVGGGQHYAGWHCSWCSTPEGNLIKLVSAVNLDFPRWGDYPAYRNITTIKKHMSDGIWFSMGKAGVPNHPMYAPKYILQNPDRFAHLLGNRNL